MNVWPLRFREIDKDRLYFADDAGGYFVSDRSFLERYVDDSLSEVDQTFLAQGGHTYRIKHDLSYLAFAWRWTARQSTQSTLSYIIVVPTLRCNLACTYCQVSRAAESATGYDWSDSVLADFLVFLDKLETKNIKIEFQGGEPLLRIDLLGKVREFCRVRFSEKQFVVCTNLQQLGPEELAFLDAEDTFVSTSLDGKLPDHNRHRTQDAALADTFFSNLNKVIQLCGASHVSALPTIDIDQPPDFESLIDTYKSIGLTSIYLRPVNYQGFARRRQPRTNDLDKWNSIYGKFIDRLIERNFRTGRIVDEFYFSYCLRRILQAGNDSHVDLRNPSLPGGDYIVVDFDGRLYPSDEARMLTRIGHIDLSVGNVKSGIDPSKIAALIPSTANNFDPDCIHCPYQPACGTDPIDDISRYGRIDIPRLNTWFCRRHLFIFDRAVKLIYSRDEKELFSLRHWVGLPSWPAALAPVHYDSTPYQS